MTDTPDTTNGEQWTKEDRAVLVGVLSNRCPACQSAKREMWDNAGSGGSYLPNFDHAGWRCLACGNSYTIGAALGVLKAEIDRLLDELARNAKEKGRITP